MKDIKAQPNPSNLRILEDHPVMVEVASLRIRKENAGHSHQEASAEDSPEEKFVAFA